MEAKIITPSDQSKGRTDTVYRVYLGGYTTYYTTIYRLYSLEIMMLTRTDC